MIDAITNKDLKLFDSISEAFRFLNKAHCGHIKRALNNNNYTYCGYKWEVYNG